MTEDGGKTTGRLYLWLVLVVIYVTGMAVWTILLSDRHRQVNYRLDGLESGRTVRMAPETRAEFDLVWREIQKIQK